LNFHVNTFVEFHLFLFDVVFHPFSVHRFDVVRWSVDLQKQVRNADREEAAHISRDERG